MDVDNGTAGAVSGRPSASLQCTAETLHAARPIPEAPGKFRRHRSEALFLWNFRSFLPQERLSIPSPIHGNVFYSSMVMVLGTGAMDMDAAEGLELDAETRLLDSHWKASLKQLSSAFSTRP